MNLLDILYSSLDSIRQNKIRSFLTLLGVIIGVFSIIGVMTAINVLQASLESNLSSLGSGNFFIQKYPAVQIGGGDRFKYRNRKNLTLDDFLKLKERIKIPDYATADDAKGGVVLSYNDVETKANMRIVGITPGWDYTNDYTLKSGRMITEMDVRAQGNVAIIGQEVIDMLMPQVPDPVGQTIRFSGEKFKIIGVWDKKGATFGQSNDQNTMIPLSKHLKMYGNPRWTSLSYTFTILDQDKFKDAMDEVAHHLRVIRKVKLGDDNDFEMVTSASLLDFFNQITDAIKLAAMLISSIALLAAGIGIMNIMLVSVSERTREIGVRKSLGARSTDIMRQFLLEALLLTQIGGIIGIILGVLAGNAIALLMDLEAVIPWDWALIGLVISSLVGAISGTYPAYKASNLDPIEALRYE